MSGGLTFLLGRANTGKSGYMTERLAACQRAGKRAVLLVPEQYTFEAEQALADALGGLMGVQVLSMERLTERVLELQGQKRPFLNTQGHRMVIRRAALKRGETLTVFGRAAGQPGFAGQMQEIFRELKQAGITPEGLTALLEKLPEGTPLGEKLRDIALLYGDTEAYLAERYMTGEDMFQFANALLPDSFLKGIPVFVDGLERPSRQTFAMMETILSTASEVSVALLVDPDEPPDKEVFLPDSRTLDRLSGMAARLGIPVKTLVLREGKKPCAPALKHLDRNLFAPRPLGYGQKAPEVTVFAASCREAEAEALAQAIQREAGRGCRYREMAVMVSDLPGCGGYVERALEKRGIPYFLDRKRPVTGHAGVDAVLSAVGAVAGGFPAEEVLRLCKSGYSGVSREDGELLENYLLATGIRGSGLQKPFTRGEVPEGAERAREILMEPLLRLREGFHERSVEGKVRALYAYLVEIGLEARLREQAEALREAGRIPLMQEHGQVWDALMSLLDQLAAILGDVDCDRKTFGKLLEEGLSGCGIGVVPGTADQVLVGDVARSKVRAVKALFVFGANDGLLPRQEGDDGLLDDGELAMMAAAGEVTLPDSLHKGELDQLDLYIAFTRPTHGLFISYAFTGEGGELAPSPLIRRLETLLPGLNKKTDLTGEEDLPDSRRAGLTRLSRLLRDYRSGNPVSPELPALLQYYAKSPAYRGRVRRMLLAGDSFRPLPPIPPEQARSVYGSKIVMSASRLEQFNTCPFKHFLRYGLAAAEQREFTERSVDFGAFYHGALDAFLKAVQARGGNWRALTEEETDGIMDALLPEVIAGHNGGIFLHNERLRATLFLLVGAVKQSARAVLRQVQAGAFTPLGSEVRFGEGQPFPALPLRLPDGTEAFLSGVIDRVDRAEIGGKPMLRVLDYKTGKRDFDFSGILHGLTLQLPLYLSAVMESGAGGAGLYYMPLIVPAAKEGEDAEETLSAAFRLRGLTLSEPAVLRASEGAMAGESTVLKGVKAGGEDTYTGNLCGAEELAGLLRRARRVSEGTLARMLHGHIEISPVENACQYCDYGSVCRFDRRVKGCRTRKYDRLKAADFFALCKDAGEGGGEHGMD